MKVQAKCDPAGERHHRADRRLAQDLFPLAGPARYRGAVPRGRCIRRRGEPPFRLYDTSGPYTDPAAAIDLDAGRAAAARAPGSRRASFGAAPPRAVQPEDNGNVSAEKLVPPCPAAHPCGRRRRGSR